MTEIYDFIDFSIKPKLLDNEFKALFPESESDDRRVDRLFEVKLKNGEEKWILLHIEIQSYEDKDFSKRMYHYYSRIFDKYDKEIEAIAVFTYKSDKHKYNEYKQELKTTKLIYQYKIYDIAIQNIQELEKSNNPFSFVIQTLIKAFDYKESDENNFNFKLELTKLLLDSGYQKQEIIRLFRFINFVFQIQNNQLRSNFYQEVSKMAVKEKLEEELNDYEQVIFEKAEIEKAKKIAKVLKLNGVDINIILKSTGLNKEEIENL